MTTEKKQHIKLLNVNKHYNSYLQDSWNKYGKDNFEFLVLKEVDRKDQFSEEQAFLDAIQPFDGNGYNLSRISIRDNYFKLLISKCCPVCGENFDSRGKHNIYCSYECSREYRTDESFANRYNNIFSNFDNYIPGYYNWENYYDSN